MSNSPKFARGDHVRLSVGGPEMVVSKVENVRANPAHVDIDKLMNTRSATIREEVDPPEVLVRCEWHDSYGRLHRESFPAEVLVSA